MCRCGSGVNVCRPLRDSGATTLCGSPENVADSLVLLGLDVGQEICLLDGERHLATLELRYNLLFDLSGLCLAGPPSLCCGVIVVNPSTGEMLANCRRSMLLRRRLLLRRLLWVVLWLLWWFG